MKDLLKGIEVIESNYRMPCPHDAILIGETITQIFQKYNVKVLAIDSEFIEWETLQ